MIEKIAIFILFLGPLVFFHELGHYFFARLFGVRVEVFSIGFGPKLFKFKKKDTEYAISAIPLGGYVKMFGDDPLNKDKIPLEERSYSFTHKGKWARFWIVMGGPLANFILAYMIFFALLLNGEKIPEVRLGKIPLASQFYEMGLRSGDVIQSINDKKIFSPADIVLTDKGMIDTVKVKRAADIVLVKPKMTGKDFFDQFIQYPPLLRQALIVNKEGKIFGLSASPTEMNEDASLEVLAHSSLDKLYLFPAHHKTGESGESAYHFESRPTQNYKVSAKGLDSLMASLGAMGFRPLDLLVKSVNMNSPADKIGLRGNDIFTKFEGENVYSFDQLRASLQKTEKKAVKLTIWSQGNERVISLTPEIKEIDGQNVKLIGVYSAGHFSPLKFVQTDSKGLLGSFLAAFDRTWDSFLKTIDGFKKLITAEVSFDKIGGPLAIGKVASDSFNTSLSYFFQLMALISINLGVINLFPIPVLDGGHIMFIFLEIFNGGPVSRRKMEIAQQLGLSLLLMLMVGAMFNDFSRYF